MRLAADKRKPIAVSATAAMLLSLAVGMAVAQAQDAKSLNIINKRTPQIEMYPCSECHTSPADYNPKKRILTEEHVDITSIHPKKRVDGDVNYWCLNCHKPKQYNQLILSSGEAIGFNASQILCGECHGQQFEDWENNMHGLRTGMWNGEGKVDLCTQCHDAHAPHFKSMKPLPPPPMPAWMMRGQKRAKNPESRPESSTHKKEEGNKDGPGGTP